MHKLQNLKALNISPPKAIVDNAAWTTNVIDTLGFTELLVIVALGAMDIAMAVLKMQESDTKTDATTLSSGADVTGLIYGTSAGIDGVASTLPSATDDNKLFAFSINLRGRKRYLQLASTGGDGSAGTYLSALAILSGAESSKDTAAEQGFANVLRV